VKVTTAGIALVVATLANAAFAASFDVVIAKLDPTATACGLSEGDLEKVARRTLESSPVQPDADAGGSLNVRVTTRAVQRTFCTARISVRMKAVAKPLPVGGTANANTRPRPPVVMLCDKGGNYQATKVTFPVKVESAVEHSIRQCLRSLRY
jgi:hypothetical protein